VPLLKGGGVKTVKLPRLAPFLYEAVWIEQKKEFGSSSKKLKICTRHDGTAKRGKEHW